MGNPKYVGWVPITRVLKEKNHDKKMERFEEVVRTLAMSTR